MSLPSKKLDVKTTPKPFGVLIEWGWGSPLNGASEIELQYINSDAKSTTHNIEYPISGVLIDGLKAGECIQVRLRRINKLGKPEEWSNKHWIECQASSDVAMILDELQVKIDKPGTFAGEIFSQPTKTYVGELSVGLDVDNKSMVKSTLNGVLVAMLPSTSPKQMVSVAGIAAEAIKKAFDHLDKESASQSQTPL